MVAIKWTQNALKDVDSIAAFIALDSNHYAKIQVNRFFEKVEILKRYPQIGRVVPEKNNPNLRELILGNYRIIYLIISEQQIDIITIHHSKRLLRNV